jgi:hypothetical protein
MAEAEKGWDDEANRKMGELQGKLGDIKPEDVKGNPLVGRPGRISRIAGKVNQGFDETARWDEKELIDHIHEDFLVNNYNKVDINDKSNFTTYLADEVVPTLTVRYQDLVNSMLHHEQAVERNAEMAPLTRVESEKVYEILEKTSEAVFKYLRTHSYKVNSEAEAKWTAARKWVKEILSALPSGEGAYRKV